jgi:hypothetical protein
LKLLNSYGRKGYGAYREVIFTINVETLRARTIRIMARDCRDLSGRPTATTTESEGLLISCATFSPERKGGAKSSSDFDAEPDHNGTFLIQNRV